MPCSSFVLVFCVGGASVHKVGSPALVPGRVPALGDWVEFVRLLAGLVLKTGSIFGAPLMVWTSLDARGALKTSSGGQLVELPVWGRELIFHLGLVVASTDFEDNFIDGGGPPSHSAMGKVNIEPVFGQHKDLPAPHMSLDLLDVQHLIA